MCLFVGMEKNALNSKNSPKSNGFRRLWAWFYSILEDTLRKEDSRGVRRWNVNYLTMFSAWITATAFSIIDFISYGFRIESWAILVGVATGMNIGAYFSNKFNKNSSNEIDAEL